MNLTCHYINAEEEQNIRLEHWIPNKTWIVYDWSEKIIYNVWYFIAVELSVSKCSSIIQHSSRKTIFNKNKSPTFRLLIYLLFVPLEFSVKFKKINIWQIFQWPIIWHSIDKCLTLASEFPIKWRSNHWNALRRIYTTFLFLSIKSEMCEFNCSLFGWHSQNILNVYSFWRIVVVFSDFLSTFTCIHI